MKKLIIFIIYTLILVLGTYFVTIHNLKVTDVEPAEEGVMITINNNNYYEHGLSTISIQSKTKLASIKVYCTLK